MGRRGNGEMERWRDGEMERWREGGMDGWRDGRRDRERYLYRGRGQERENMFLYVQCMIAIKLAYNIRVSTFCWPIGFSNINDADPFRKIRINT